MKCWKLHVTTTFQFTPLREGRRIQRIRHQSQADFNSRPSARGDVQDMLYTELMSDFNSRPSARGDATHKRRRERKGYFNSRPSARGDPQARRQGRHDTISIHAPPRGATCNAAVRELATIYFNSRPSARGDGESMVGCAVCGNFNSRPSARGDGKRYAISANLLFNPYKSAWLNNSATQFVEIILVIFHRIIV